MNVLPSIPSPNILIGTVFFVLLSGVGTGRAGASNCADLLELQWPELTILEAEPRDAVADSPAHCRVLGVFGTEIRFELLLPDDWNGKFLMGGGGGFVGNIQNHAMGNLEGGNALQRGYATAGTDTGHQDEGIEADWAYNNLERKVNFGYLAVHQVAQVAKAIIQHYYGRDIAYSYFSGCSRGGGQAMMESQRYPDDFDGIIAGAPAYDWNGLGGAMLQTQKAMYPDPGNLSEPIITPEVQALLQARIMESCDSLDGVEDGVLEDPRACPFDPTSLPRCSGANDDVCVTDDQLSAIHTIYGAATGGSGTFYPGFPFGGENDGPGGWTNWIIGGEDRFGPGVPSLHYAFGTEMYKYLFFNDPEWDFRSYDFSTYKEDTAIADHFLNAKNTDLEGLKESDGKLIMWHGWSDSAISALSSIDYFEAVKENDPDVDSYFRLFMMPGVLHCAGGPGPDRVDWIQVLENWVERREAPDAVIATKKTETGSVTRSRPLCPYPAQAVYGGTGSTDEAENFACEMPSSSR